MDGDIKPGQSFLLAAKSDCLSNFIKADLLCVNVSSLKEASENGNACTASSTTFHMDKQTNRDLRASYQWAWCLKDFTRICNLAKHTCTDTHVKSYECKPTYKQFRKASHLRKHEAVHRSAKYYGCETLHVGNSFQGQEI